MSDTIDLITGFMPLPIFIAILSCLGVITIQKIGKKSMTILAFFLILLITLILSILIPFLPSSMDWESLGIPLLPIIPYVILWILAFVFLFIGIKDHITIFNNWICVFFPSFLASAVLLILSTTHSSLLLIQDPINSISLPLSILAIFIICLGIFIEGCIVVSAVYGALIICNMVYDFFQGKNTISRVREHLVIVTGGLVVATFINFIIPVPDSTRLFFVLILWSMIAGTTIVFFTLLSGLKKKIYPICVPLTLALVFIGAILVVPSFTSIFFLGGGTLIIIISCLGSVTLLSIFAHQIHISLIETTLVISSSVIVLGLNQFGILPDLFYLDRWNSPVFSDPEIFLVLFVASAIIPAILCGILTFLMNRSTNVEVK